MAPTKTRYKQLCEAYQTGVGECNSYREECYDFVQDLRAHLIGTLKCPETKFFMFPPSQGFAYTSHLMQGDALDTEFANDGVALIGFAINLNDRDIEDRFITFIVTFKKINDRIVFGIYEDEKEFDDTCEDIENFCTHLFALAKKNLANRLKIFLFSPLEESSPIGFKVGAGEKSKKLISEHFSQA